MQASPVEWHGIILAAYDQLWRSFNIVHNGQSALELFQLINGRLNVVVWEGLNSLNVERKRKCK